MMSDDELRQAVRRASKDGRIPCRTLLELSRRAGVSPREVGRMCDEMDIRISECQLGCFE